MALGALLVQSPVAALNCLWPKMGKWEVVSVFNGAIVNRVKNKTRHVRGVRLVLINAND